jgi:arylsulfatase A-like enzyme
MQNPNHPRTGAGCSGHLPNFLVFCVDQMQSYCLGCNGHPVVKTPNLDALAARGVNFRRGYCNNPVCMPSRATMITGRTPRQHGLLTNGNSLSPDVPTVTQALADAGYRTHSVGKLHLQPFGGFFDEHSDSLELGRRWRAGELTKLPSPYYGYQTTDFVGGHVNYAFGEYRHWLEEHHPESEPKLAKDQAYYACGVAFRLGIPAEHHYNHWIADRAIDFLGKVAGASSSGIKGTSGSGETGAGCSGHNPFFLFCSFPDPHFPFAACRPYSEMYDPDALPLPETMEARADACAYLAAKPRGKRPENPEEMREILAQTYGMISHIDANVGRVMSALAANGLAENTIVLFVADHGEYLGGHNLLYKGAWPFEELWRIPFLAAGPGVQPGICEVPVSLLDLTPTFLDYAGLDPLTLDTRGPGPLNRLPPPGRSLRPFLEGRLDAPREPLVMEYDEDLGEGPICRLRGLIDGAWKIVLYGGFDDGVLFHLADDPCELRNLWHEPQAQGRKAELLARLVQRLAQTDRFDAPRRTGA